MRITQRLLASAKPGFYWDDELKGFGLKVTPHKKVFLVQKRPHKGAKQLKRWTLGAYPLLSLQDARTRAKHLLATLTLGVDSSPVQSQSGASFVDELEKFYHEHIMAKLKPSTQADMRYMIDSHLIPAFGELSLAEVTPSVVRSFHSRLGSKHPYRANRVLALLSKFFTWAVPQTSLTANPCRGITKFREKRRELNTSKLDVTELLHPSVHPAIRLLLLTGMRKSEVLSLRWEYLDLPGSLIRLPDTKTGARSIYLSQDARELLASLPANQEGWVFPAERPDGRTGHLVGLQKIWKRTLSQLGLDSTLRLHDLRHHYATIASRDLSLPLVKDLLGHKDIKTTVRYVHSQREDLRAAVQTVGQKLSNGSQPL